jgi:hypothetical protein
MYYLFLAPNTGEPTVKLGSAANYVILAKAGISTVPGGLDAIIYGDIAVSPITGAAMTGFAFTRDSSGEFSYCNAQINGKAYGANYAAPTPAKLTVAVLAMQTAYTNAAGRLNPNAARINLGGGLLGGAKPGGPTDQLTPGVYTFNSVVSIGGNLHFNGMCSIACILLLFCTNIALKAKAQNKITRAEIPVYPTVFNKRLMPPLADKLPTHAVKRSPQSASPVF